MEKIKRTGAVLAALSICAVISIAPIAVGAASADELEVAPSTVQSTEGTTETPTAPTTEAVTPTTTEKAGVPAPPVEAVTPTVAVPDVSAPPTNASAVGVRTSSPAPEIGTVLWEVTSTTADVFLTPQVYVTEISSDNVNYWNSGAGLKCGTKYQADAYPKPAIPGLTADKLLKGGEDGGIALHWNVFTTAPCTITPVQVPDFQPLPPTCDTDGSLSFLGNPAAQNPNGYEFPGQGYRVYVSPAFTGPGTYTLTIQKIGPKFDLAFWGGTKVTGNVRQVLTVLPKTGYHNTVNGARACYVAPVEPKVTNTEWVDGTFACGDSTVNQTRTVTTVPQVFDTVTGTYSDGATTSVVESQTRTLAASAVTVCPVTVVEPPVVVDAPVAAAVDKPVAAKQSLAYTGAGDVLPWLLFGGGLVALGFLIWLLRKVRPTK